MKEGSTRLWDYWARRYTSLLVQGWVLGPTRREVIGLLKKRPVPPTAVLDVGCGIGQLARDMAGEWPDARITALDYSPEMIRRGSLENPAPRITYLCGRLDDVSGSFDTVTSTHSFPYLPDKQAAALRIFRLLTPGGRFILVSLQVNTFYDFLAAGIVKLTTWKAQYWSKKRLGRIAAAAGFRLGTVTRIKPVFFMPSVYLMELIKD